MGGKDKISVIVPCYNVQQYIMRCFDSIYNQTYGFENLEVILVDDLSTDNTWSILELLQKKYPENVISVRMDKKGLPGGARNSGVDISSGKYITYVDGDDWIHSEMINVFYSKMQEDNFDFVQCEYIQCRKEPEEKYIDPDYSYDIYDLTDINMRKSAIIRLTATGNITVWGKLYNADFIKHNNIRFVENRCFEDNNFSFMCVMLARKYCKISPQLYFYYLKNDNSITHTSFNLEKIRDLKQNMDDIRAMIGKGIFDSHTENACKYEIQCFLFWKECYECIRRVEDTMNNEINYYVNEELTIEPDILDSPYIKNMSSPAVVKVINYLQLNIEKGKI